jgi:hypothetical protein
VSELRRWLKAQGCVFQERTKHTLVIRGKRFSLMPRYPAKEIKKGTLRSIL